MNVQIRRPKPVDSQELHILFRTVITDTFIKENLADLVDDIEEEIKTKVNYLNMDYESNGENRFFLLALINDCIIGTIEIGPSNNLINKLTNGELNNTIEVGTVLILPEFQKRGIGSLLFNTMLLTLQSQGIEEFCLDSGYRQAQKYWMKKLGEPDYLFQNYWNEGNDHMIWIKRTSAVPIIFNI